MICPYCGRNIGISPKGIKASTTGHRVPIVIVSCQYCQKVLGIAPDTNQASASSDGPAGAGG